MLSLLSSHQMRGLVLSQSMRTIALCGAPLGLSIETCAKEYDGAGVAEVLASCVKRCDRRNDRYSMMRRRSRVTVKVPSKMSVLFMTLEASDRLVLPGPSRQDTRHNPEHQRDLTNVRPWQKAWSCSPPGVGAALRYYSLFPRPELLAMLVVS